MNISYIIIFTYVRITDPDIISFFLVVPAAGPAPTLRMGNECADGTEVALSAILQVMKAAKYITNKLPMKSNPTSN